MLAWQWAWHSKVGGGMLDDVRAANAMENTCALHTRPSRHMMPLNNAAINVCTLEQMKDDKL
jgi:hypothetical protein